MVVAEIRREAVDWSIWLKGGDDWWAALWTLW